MEIITSSS